MKIPSQTAPSRRRRQGGFTLPELATAIGLSLAIAGMMMSLLQQQVSFHKILRAQNFLVEEAPLINNSISAILSQADAFRIHTSLSDAIADAGAVTSGGNVLVVGFQNADGTREFGILSFEDTGTESYLGYYSVDPSVPFSGAGNPDWIVSKRVTDADFFIENGVFRIQLTGPAGETITYAATPRL